MAIEIEQLCDRIRNVDLKGLIRVETRKLGEDDDRQPVVELSLLKLKGALKNDQSEAFRMIIGVDNPDGRPNDLRFIVPAIDKCEAFSKDLTVYMDANWNTIFGAHKWDPHDGEIRFTYCLPIPESASEDFPDTPLLQRILSDMYEGLLFHDVKLKKWSIDGDDMLNDEEKKAKMKRLDEIAAGLLGSAQDQADDGI